MPVINIGSINIDYVHRVPHFPAAGETLRNLSYSAGLGGKGANQSIAIALAGGQVDHVGRVGEDGLWAKDKLTAHGVNTSNILTDNGASGHAVIYVDNAGENTIVIHGGANENLTKSQIANALDSAQPGDWLLLQNETNMILQAAQAAKAKGLKVAYAAAPFDAAIAAKMIPHVDLIAVNEIEAAQLADTMHMPVNDLPVEKILITKGSKGATYSDGDESFGVKAFKVTPVDTTGAGDTFTGYFLARLDLGDDPATALKIASAAAAIQVTRPGAADAIPTISEVFEFLETHK
ncbi:ribokinase [Maritalea porphyrae]|jgi:ribokinase|uniref:ribokinase n=1 Tax=Maritalea porphyrae TaxID=880732 RepID=UPI0022AEE5E7|nr:ribokinase [Maritalea porphyrae]MCZ4274068.1 ribokinase [Maritalea porphyrae]